MEPVVRLRAAVSLLGRFPALAGIDLDVGAGEFLAVVRANFPPGTPIVIGCQMGGRSAKAAEILASAGYQDVANVLGGFGGAPQFGHAGWVKAGLPVATKANADRDYEALRKNASGSR